MGLIGVRYWLRGSARLRGVYIRSMILSTAVSKYILSRNGRPRLENLSHIMWTEVNQLSEGGILPPQPPPYHNFPPRRISARSPPQQPCSASRLISGKDTVEPERSDQNKRWEFSLDIHIGEEENIKSKMKPQRTTLNHHQLARVLKHPDNRVSRARRCNEQPSAAVGMPTPA